MQVTYYQFMVYPTQIKNTEMFAKKFPSDNINGTKNALFFIRELQLITIQKQPLEVFCKKRCS